MSEKSLAERETLIRRAADEQEWEVFSEDPRVIRKLERLIGKGVQKANSDGFVWRVGAAQIRFAAPVRMSEERKRKAVEVLRSVREKAALSTGTPPRAIGAVPAVTPAPVGAP